MADAPDPITSPPSQPPAPYDATSTADMGPWVKSDDSGPCDMQGSVSGDWPSSGVWQQT
jgi:hypothetical protein